MRFKEKHGESVSGRHGLTPEYSAWVNMIGRCENPNVTRWKRYGERGVKVCAEWRGDFLKFLAYVGRRPSPAHSLDRFPDNDGDYKPGNVRWATDKEQSRNTSRNMLLKVGGKTMTLAEASERSGIRRETISHRIKEWGWSHEKAVSRPPNPRVFMCRGKLMTGPEIIEKLGIPRSSFYRRIQRHGGNADLAIAEWEQNGMGKKNLR